MSLALRVDSLSSLIQLLSHSKDITSQISSLGQDIKNLQSLTRIEVNSERQRILDFFLKVNPQRNLDTSIKMRHPGTGNWLTSSRQFQEWIDTPGSKMWLSGIPGAGKTVLAGAMIQKALEKGKSSPKVAVAFFYCDYKDGQSAVPSNIPGAIASQLARQNGEAFKKLKELYNLLNPRDGLPKGLDPDLLQDCLEEMFKDFEQVIVVVDGLDECGDNVDAVVDALTQLADYQPNVSMALLSRSEHLIKLKLRDSFPEVLISAHKEDLLLYVGAELDKRKQDGRLRIGNLQLKDKIYATLCNRADGMFRLVTCQLDYLCDCPTDADRAAALRELPPTLDATYERILQRINQKHHRVRDLVRKCLQLLAIQWHTLDADALCAAVSVPENIAITLTKYNIVTKEEIVIQCSGLVRYSESERRLEYSHYTVREFLERETLSSNPEFASYFVSEATCNATLVQQYLRCLQLGNFSSTSVVSRPDLSIQELTEDIITKWASTQVLFGSCPRVDHRYKTSTQ
ncbi:hypothetical protein F5Y17DRAFT_454559 [Xylariaceae sp. FL0594]|nr:hypothetical protein F5Y17DRAFT_454559 [Xylariaceae sp. FL0594]